MLRLADRSCQSMKHSRSHCRFGLRRKRLKTFRPSTEFRKSLGSPSHGPELKLVAGNELTTHERSLGGKNRDAQHRSSINQQQAAAEVEIKRKTGLPGLPGPDGSIHPQPGWAALQWHILKLNPLILQLCELWWYRTYRSPGQEIGTDARGIRRAVLNPKSASHHHAPVPTTVADQQDAPGICARHSQIPSPIIPSTASLGRWIPHSCFSPPKRVSRPLRLSASGPLECQSPTVE